MRTACVTGSTRFEMYSTLPRIFCGRNGSAIEGLAPPIVRELLRIIGQTVASGEMAVILVEQHAHQTVPLTRHAPVLERGRVVFSGESEALRKDRSRLDQWLGVGSHQEPTEMGSKRIE